MDPMTGKDAEVENGGKERTGVKQRNSSPMLQGCFKSFHAKTFFAGKHVFLQSQLNHQVGYGPRRCSLLTILTMKQASFLCSMFKAGAPRSAPPLDPPRPTEAAPQWRGKTQQLLTRISKVRLS